MGYVGWRGKATPRCGWFGVSGNDLCWRLFDFRSLDSTLPFSFQPFWKLLFKRRTRRIHIRIFITLRVIRISRNDDCEAALWNCKRYSIHIYFFPNRKRTGFLESQEHLTFISLISKYVSGSAQQRRSKQLLTSNENCNHYRRIN